MEIRRGWFMLDRNRQRRLPRATNVSDGTVGELLLYYPSACAAVYRAIGCPWRKSKMVDPRAQARCRSWTGQSSAWMVSVR